MFDEKEIDLLKFGVASLLFGNEPITGFDLVYDCNELPVSVEDRIAIGEKCLNLEKEGLGSDVIDALNRTIPLVLQRREEYESFGKYLLTCGIEYLRFKVATENEITSTGRWRTPLVSYYSLMCSENSGGLFKKENYTFIGVLSIFPKEDYMRFTYAS